MSCHSGVPQQYLLSFFVRFFTLCAAYETENLFSHVSEFWPKICFSPDKPSLKFYICLCQEGSKREMFTPAIGILIQYTCSWNLSPVNTVTNPCFSRGILMLHIFIWNHSLVINVRNVLHSRTNWISMSIQCTHSQNCSHVNTVRNHSDEKSMLNPMLIQYTYSWNHSLVNTVTNHLWQNKLLKCTLILCTSIWNHSLVISVKKPIQSRDNYKSISKISIRI